MYLLYKYTLEAVLPLSIYVLQKTKTPLTADITRGESGEKEGYLLCMKKREGVWAKSQERSKISGVIVVLLFLLR